MPALEQPTATILGQDEGKNQASPGPRVQNPALDDGARRREQHGEWQAYSIDVLVAFLDP